MGKTMPARPAGHPPAGRPPASGPPGTGLQARDLAEGVDLLAASANVIMQLARPEVGYGVVESRVERAQIMRHPVRRWLTTVTYLSVALMGSAQEREYFRRLVNRSHAEVRSTHRSPVSYRAFDPELQLWVAACLYQGMRDMHERLHGPADGPTADAIYRWAGQFGTTLQVPESMWPPDRAAFGEYWRDALASIRIDPPVRDYLEKLIMLGYLPRPFGRALGGISRFVTTGFLPPPFRDQMRLPWTERDQRRFDAALRVAAVVNHWLPAPARRFPFNACLLGLRARIGWEHIRPGGNRPGGRPLRRTGSSQPAPVPDGRRPAVGR